MMDGCASLRTGLRVSTRHSAVPVDSLFELYSFYCYLGALRRNLMARFC